MREPFVLSGGESEFPFNRYCLPLGWSDGPPPAPLRVVPYGPYPQAVAAGQHPLPRRRRVSTIRCHLGRHPSEFLESLRHSGRITGNTEITIKAAVGASVYQCVISVLPTILPEPKHFNLADIPRLKPVSMTSERNDIQLLAQFRREIRRFLQFSEQAAAAAGLQPQQHQLLLQIAGASDDTLVTISHIADVMSLRHHTVVELSKRCELAGLVRRTHDPNESQVRGIRTDNPRSPRTSSALGSPCSAIARVSPWPDPGPQTHTQFKTINGLRPISHSNERRQSCSQNHQYSGILWLIDGSGCFPAFLLVMAYAQPYWPHYFCAVSRFRPTPGNRGYRKMA